VFDFFAQLIYPKRCVACRKGGDYICDEHFSKISFLTNQFCGVCQKGSIDGMTHPKCRSKFGIDGIISAISYRGVVKKLIYKFKYEPYLSDLKGTLGKLMYEGLIQQEAFEKYLENGNVVLVPVPLHKRRERSRGYNQSELLAKELSKHLGLPVISLLTRNIDTKPQFDLSKKDRSSNIRGAFSLNPRPKTLIPQNIILIDDITTTGATLRECAKILKANGVKKVLGVTLAHEG
jgi:ComF family protein